MTWTEIINNALRRIFVLEKSGRGGSASQIAEGKSFLNGIIDEWAARRIYAYNVAFSAFTLTPDHQPHTIGPDEADFTAPRPVRIEAAALILPGAQPVDVPLRIRDDDWWARKRVKGISTTVPTDLYYSPDMPNGSLYLWPVPAAAYGLRLETWVSVQQISDVTASFVGPPGYAKALELTLAEELCSAHNKPIPVSLLQQATRARAAIQGNNSKSPRISTADYGTRGGGRGGFNYFTGGPA